MDPKHWFIKILLSLEKILILFGKIIGGRKKL